MPDQVPQQAVEETVAQALCAWEYCDQSGRTWGTLNDRGQESFREYACGFLASLTNEQSPDPQPQPGAAAPEGAVE